MTEVSNMAILLQPSSEADRLYEVVDGEEKEIPHMGALAGSFASFLISFLNGYAIPRKIGFAVTEVMFQLRPGQPQRRPDVAFITYDRWPLTALPTEDPPAWEVVPNMTVEVVSPTNTAEGIEEKVQEYFEVGVQLVWVVFPKSRRIHVYETPTQSRVLRDTDELEGGQVVPGFRVKIADLFAPLVRAN